MSVIEYVSSELFVVYVAGSEVGDHTFHPQHAAFPGWGTDPLPPVWPVGLTCYHGRGHLPCCQTFHMVGSITAWECMGWWNVNLNGS